MAADLARRARKIEALILAGASAQESKKRADARQVALANVVVTQVFSPD
jgi:hypothetical protein